MANIKDMKSTVSRPERVIQFGEGGFLRGFVDWMLQKINETTDFDGNVVVVQPIEKGMCDMLTAQNGLYTHIIRGKEGVDKTVVDVISRCVKPYEDFEAYMALAENPDFRFIFSNTTEAGIVFQDTDKPTDMPPASFPAKLTLLLKRRFDLGLRGFILIPCELIDRNGDNLKKAVLSYAKLWGYEEAFAAWVEKENVFCNTLVDRIVTGYPRGENIELGYEDNMLNTSELFHLWVIEGPQQVGVEFPFAKTGLNVILTDNMTPYRTRKVRILNGSHTSMIPYAMLEGLETVGDCMADEKMSKFLRGCLFEEIIPTLDLPEEELLDYANNVLERFRNPYIRHLCSSICLNSVSKFKVRVLPSILEYIKRKNEMPKYLILSFAKLIEFYKNGTPIDDPAIIEEMKKSDIPAILANKAFWDEDLSFLADAVMNASAEGLV
jgi:tagaturonate reductase